MNIDFKRQNPKSVTGYKTARERKGHNKNIKKINKNVALNENQCQFVRVVGH